MTARRGAWLFFAFLSFASCASSVSEAEPPDSSSTPPLSDTAQSPLDDHQEASEVAVPDAIEEVVPAEDASGGPAQHPLYEAVLNDEIETAQELLERGLDPNERVAAEGRTVIFAASAEMTVLLVAFGAEVDLRSDVGVSPMELAVQIGDVSKVEALLASGSDPGEALFEAVAWASPAALELVMMYGDFSLETSPSAGSPWAEELGLTSVADLVDLIGTDSIEMQQVVEALS